MKKYNTEVQNPQILIICGCNRFFRKLEGGVSNKYIIRSFNGQAEVQILAKKTLLDELPGAPQYEKIQNTVEQQPEITILFDLNFPNCKTVKKRHVIGKGV